VATMKTPLLDAQGGSEPRRVANRRTALVLLSIALVFFGGIIASQLVGGTTIGIVVVGFGIIGFLLVAIERGRK
jgi:hypothetical protein